MDADGKLWFPGTDRVVRFDPATNEQTEWNMAGVVVVTAMGLDSQGRPALGGQVSATSPLYGVARLEPSTGLPTLWPFTSSSIRGIVADSSDNFWLNTADLKIRRVVP